ncbi:MAG: DNA primase [Ruminococcaceae bacterium]|nr:DNA primase [Oscillospiraceae bacterium]
MISPQIIEEIKYRNDIEEVISQHVSLKRAGNNLIGLCPFHSEKTPSFTVFTGTKSFYCFGCGAGGDVISFVMRTENLTYVDALRALAKRSGIEIPEDDKAAQTGVRRERIIEMNKDAARFFHECLKKSKEAQEYVAKRNLSTALIKHFGVGYAPNDFEALAKHLRSKGYTQEEMKEGFLCSISKKNGKSYDIFRNRIMFPIIDVKGDIIAFGGRTLNNDKSEAKYINTNDTPVFNKRRNLFALNYAKNSCSDQMILCEGYMDVISLHGAGFTNAVASCGTAFTPDQARLMKKYTKSAIICFDADEAGQRNADKVFKLLSEVGLEAKLLKVENAKDPDEFIGKFGKEAFTRLLNRSRSRFDFKFSSIIAKYNINDVNDKVKAASELSDLLASGWSEVERDVYSRQVAKHLDISLESFKADIKRKMSKNEKAEKKDFGRSVMMSTEGYGDRINPDRLLNQGAAGAEDAIIGILATYPELIPSAESKLGLKDDDFVTEFNRLVYKKMTELGSGFDIGLIGDEFSQEQISRIVRNSVSRQSLTDNGEKVLGECIARLKALKKKEDQSLEDLIASKRNKI